MTDLHALEKCDKWKTLVYIQSIYQISFEVRQTCLKKKTKQTKKTSGLVLFYMAMPTVLASAVLMWELMGFMVLQSFLDTPCFLVLFSIYVVTMWLLFYMFF